MSIKINIGSGNQQHEGLNKENILLKQTIKPKTINHSKNQDLTENIFADIEDLIGLQEIKSLISEIYAFSLIQKKRKLQDLHSETPVLHTIFKGNPGSGKTTMARLLAKMYKDMGLLSKGHFVEVERADLVGEFIGHTAKKTKDQLKKALGGILFIDEAYSLCRGGNKDFGREAIDVLVKGMEDHKEDFVLVLAGYPKEMNMFLNTNPGLHSRFPLHIDFPDYDQHELLAIAQYMYKKRDYYTDDLAFSELKRYIERQLLTKNSLAGNARSIRNIVEASLRSQAMRLINDQQDIKLNREALSQIAHPDIKQAIAKLEKTNAREYPRLSSNLS